MRPNQTTRFVRALLRGIQAYMRNMVCLWNINGKIQAYCQAQDPPDNTGAKEAEIKVNEISNPVFIATLVGLSQMLEEYAQYSLGTVHTLHVLLSNRYVIVGIAHNSYHNFFHFLT